MQIYGLLFLSLFILCGVYLSYKCLNKVCQTTRIAVGLAIAVALFAWLPALVSFFIGFNLLAQIIAAVIMVLLCVLVGILTRKVKKTTKNIGFSDLIMMASSIFVTVLILKIMNTHYFLEIDAYVTVGQSTFGDLCLHSGIAKALLVQGVLPMDYPIYPGLLLSYPFLADTSLTSLMLFGISVRDALLITGGLWSFTVVLSVLAFAKNVLGSVWASILAGVFFIFNGGFGFIYYMDGFKFSASKIADMMTGFYNTPTNNVGVDLRWVNVICDMMIPQRTTLLGWAVAISAIMLLFLGIKRRDKLFLLISGIISGLLPLINTHSYLAVGLIAASWIFSYLRFDDIFIRKEKIAVCDACSENSCSNNVACNQQGENIEQVTTGESNGEEEIGLNSDLKSDSINADICIKEYETTVSIENNFSNETTAENVSKQYEGNENTKANCNIDSENNENKPKPKKEKIKLNKTAIFEYFKVWCCFGIPAVLIALPQLIKFTLSQATSDGFLRFALGWVIGDANYVSFWVINVGIVAVLYLPTLIFASRERRRFMYGSLVIFVISQLFIFQPNPYDNNKLLYMSYLIAAIAVAGGIGDFLTNVITVKRVSIKTADGVSQVLLSGKMQKNASSIGIIFSDKTQAKQYKNKYNAKKAGVIATRAVIIVVVLVLGTLSAVMSLAREYVSSYPLFNSYEKLAAEFVLENTNPTDVFLTGSQHNEPITTISGRSIYMGTPTYLVWHGVDISDRQSKVREYLLSVDNIKQAKVDGSFTHIYWSTYEEREFGSITHLLPALDKLYSGGGVTIYRIK